MNLNDAHKDLKEQGDFNNALVVKEASDIFAKTNIQHFVNTCITYHDLIAEKQKIMAGLFPDRGHLAYVNTRLENLKAVINNYCSNFSKITGESWEGFTFL